MKTLRLLAATLLAPLAFAAFGERVSGKDYEVVTLAAGVYGFVWTDPSAQPVEGNALFIVNDVDVVVVDTGLMPLTTRRMIEEIRKLTPKPVSLVVNTHWHDDHTNGNGLYREAWPQVRILAHPFTRIDHIERTIQARPANLDQMAQNVERYAQLAEKGLDEKDEPLDPGRRQRIRDFVAMLRDNIPELRAVKDSPADLTIEGRAVLERGERTIEILYLGRGNTRGDLVVFLPKERIVATGDLLVYPIPFMFGSYYAEWAQTLEKLAALPADTLFLAHGAPQRDRDYLRKVQALLRDLDARARAAAASGLPVDEAKKQVDLKDWSEKFSNGNAMRAREFDAFVVAPAVERAIRQARGEPEAFAQKLR